MSNYSLNRTWILASLLLALAISYGFFEITRHEKLSEAQQTELAEQSLKSAARSFFEYEHNFAAESRELADRLAEEIRANSSHESMFNIINREYDFWGTSVFEDKELWLWDAFADKIFKDMPDSSQQYVDVHRRNNVTYFISHIPFFITEGDSSTRFDLFTTRKIQQENILPIGKTVEQTASQIFNSEFDYPVYFSFFTTISENALLKTKLSTKSVDSVGVAYTVSEGHSHYQEAKQDRNELIRTLFILGFILIGMLLLMSFAASLEFWESLLLRIFSIFIAWLLLSNLQIGLEWSVLFGAVNEGNIKNIQLVFNYCLDTLSILLISLAIFSTFLKQKESAGGAERISHINPFWALMHGLLSLFLFYFYLSQTYRLFVESTISVMDLNVFPPTDTLIIYIASGIFSFSLIILNSFIGWLLLKNTSAKWWLTQILSIAGFSSGAFILSQFTIFEASYFWIVFACSLFLFVVILFSSLIYLSPNTFFFSSRLRLLLLLGFITVSITYIAVFKGNSERMNNQMLTAAESFIEEEASEAERIARTLLMDLEKNLSGLTAQDMNQRPEFVDNLFLQQTQNLISDEWESFSISTQFVNNEGEIISEYTSDLDSPGWTRAFNMLSLLIPFEEERIRINNIRPVIRERPLNETNSNYSSFRRGWIPLHEANENQSRVGWILCSVYRERPQLQKPLRAVIAAESNENWNASINITEFISQQAARKSIVGIPLELPGYVRLPDQLTQNILQDSIYIHTATFGNSTIRELFVATSQNQIIRAATSYTGIDNHLFALLRYFFCVLIGGLVLLAAFIWRDDIVIIDHNRRFRDRLIDRFILATLFCLVLLTVTSYYAIQNQNEKNIQSELLDKVNNLAVSLSQQQTGNDTIGSLNELSSALDSDASIYQNAVLDISTTSQIYSQHLLPEMLPWDVFHSIYFNGNNQETRIITLGNHELLIGFQPWLNEDGNIAGIVAIPTFLKAPKFNEQILSTTSYLLGFYVIIFGLFILGAALISTQLTAPLHSIRQGLKRISGGDLETILPVQSKDEIGSLTNAYNIMVYRLKDLQQELSKAEREAAWKEMAQQVAHEIKNPLTPMKLNLQHLERQIKASESDLNELRPNIEKITAGLIEQIESLNQIASDFSKFARPIQQSFELLDLNNLVKSVIELYSSEEKVVVKSKLWPGAISVHAAKDEIRRALINLIKNAVEAMPHGGEILIMTAAKEREQLAVITIKDTGEGISPDNYKNIFVPNFSTKTSGTGLGLAITKKIIEEHNGSISFESPPENGSTFIISLPLAEE